MTCSVSARQIPARSVRAELDHAETVVDALPQDAAGARLAVDEQDLLGAALRAPIAAAMPAVRPRR